MKYVLQGYFSIESLLGLSEAQLPKGKKKAASGNKTKGQRIPDQRGIRMVLHRPLGRANRLASSLGETLSEDALGFGKLSSSVPRASPARTRPRPKKIRTNVLCFCGKRECAVNSRFCKYCSGRRRRAAYRGLCEYP